MIPNKTEVLNLKTRKTQVPMEYLSQRKKRKRKSATANTHSLRKRVAHAHTMNKQTPSHNGNPIVKPSFSATRAVTTTLCDCTEKCKRLAF
jgi:hypothetical protein